MDDDERPVLDADWPLGRESLSLRLDNCAEVSREGAEGLVLYSRVLILSATRAGMMGTFGMQMRSRMRVFEFR